MYILHIKYVYKIYHELVIQDDLLIPPLAKAFKAYEMMDYSLAI